MRYWTYCFHDGGKEFDGVETLSEKDILDSYFPHWLSMMAKAGKDLPPNAEQVCIDDWVVVHWAVESDANGVMLDKRN